MTTWPMLTLLLVMGVVVLADDSVRLLTKSTSTLTSSTLRWVHGNQAASFMTEMVRGAIARPEASEDYAADATTEDAEVEEEVPVMEVDQEGPLGQGEKSILVCRARHNGDLLPGALIRDECMVSLARQVARYKRYDVLRNVEGSSRLQWRHWTRFNGIPVGAVSADGQGYVARRRAAPDAEHSYNMGRLDLSVGLGRVYVMEPDASGSWVEKDYIEGEVLVELEPIKYELQNVVLNERRVKLQQRPRVLATTVLRREANEENQELEELETNDATPPQESMFVANALTYWEEPSSEYWGQGRGMLRGLNTAIHVKSESVPRVIEWGVNSTHPGSERAVTVQAKLPAGTGQNVSVTGNHTTSETPYTALLIAHYKDGVTRSRTINGTVNQVSLQGVKIIYGAHYFLHDGSLVPTTTTTSTTPSSTTSSTTPSTTTTTTTTAKAAVANQVREDTKVEAEVAMSTDKNVAQSLNVSPSSGPVSCRQSVMIVIASCLLVIGFRSGT